MHINLLPPAQLNKSLSQFSSPAKIKLKFSDKVLQLPQSSNCNLIYRLMQTLLSSSKISDESAELLKTQTLQAEVFEHSRFPLIISFVWCPSNNCQINGINRCFYCSKAAKTKGGDTAETAVVKMNEIQHWNSSSSSKKILSVLRGSQATTCWARPTSRWNGASSSACRGTGRTSRKQHIPFQVSPSLCRSRWNYSPQHSTEKASIWYLSCLLWETNYKWHSCLAEPTLTTRGARQTQHNCTDSSSGVSRDFQGNHAWQEGHSHLNLSLLPDSPQAVPTYCSSRNCAQKEREQFSARQQNQWAVRWAHRLKEWPLPTAGWLSHLSLLQPCQRGLCSAPQPEPTSRAKIFTFSIGKIASGYNTVSNGSLHSSEIDPEATTYSY